VRLLVSYTSVNALSNFILVLIANGFIGFIVFALLDGDGHMGYWFFDSCFEHFGFFTPLVQVITCELWFIVLIAKYRCNK
jgi:hypothetical protein